MVHILAHVDRTRRTALHARLRAANTAASPALARLRESSDDDEVPLHIWALEDEEDDKNPSDAARASSGTPDGALGSGRDSASPQAQSHKAREAGQSISPKVVALAIGGGNKGSKDRGTKDVDGESASPTQPQAAQSQSQSQSSHSSQLPHPSTASRPYQQSSPAAKPSSPDMLGGLVGHTWARWLHITYLYVTASARGTGLGRTLLDHAERIARERGCVAAIVQTWDFQATEFYAKFGYEVKGMVEGYPPGITDYTLVKRFDGADQGGAQGVGTKRCSLGVTDV